MITTAWNSLFATDNLLPESDVNVVCNDNVVDTSSGWSVSANNEESISNVQSFLKSADNIAQRNPTKIATFEWNFFVLDGSFKIANDSTRVNRYVSSEICDENCEFSIPPTISYASSILGPKYVTLKFAPQIYEYATDLTSYGIPFAIDAYDNDYVVLGGIAPTDYDVSITKWSMPFRRARLSEFLIGARVFFDKSVISKMSHERSTDMVCAELPQNDLNLSVLDTNNDWDKNNPNAKYVGLINTDSTFKVYYAFKLDSGWDWRWVDTLSVKSLDRPSNGLEANFVLESDLNRKNNTFINDNSDNSNFAWDKYSTLLNRIATKTGLSFNSSQIHHDFFNPATGGANYRPYLCLYFRGQQTPNQLSEYFNDTEYYGRQMREWVQILSAAMLSFIRRNPNGSISLIGLLNFSTGNFLSSTVVDTIVLNNCFEYPEIENLKKISKVILSVKPENSNCCADREWNGLPKYRYTFNYNVDGVEQEATNHLLMIIKESSNPTFGYSVSDGLHSRYARYLYRFMSEAMRIKVKCRINPAWQVGDLVGMQLKNGRTAKGFITRIELEYTGYPQGYVTILAPKTLN